MNKKMLIGCVSAILISPIIFSGEPTTIGGKVHASTTNLRFKDMFRVFSKDSRIILISIIDAFGYSEHFCIGRVKNEITGRIEEAAFFQTYSYDASLKETHVIRRMVFPIKSGTNIDLLFSPKEIKQIVGLRNKPIPVRDGSHIRIFYWMNGELDLMLDSSRAMLKSDADVLKWLKKIGRKYSFQFNDIEMPLTTVPALLTSPKVSAAGRPTIKPIRGQATFLDTSEKSGEVRERKSPRHREGKD